VFFQTDSDIRYVLPVSNGFHLTTISSYLLRADYSFMQKELIGTVLYKALKVEYLANAYTEPSREEAVKLLQIASAFYAYALYIPLSGVISSDIGLHVEETAKHRIAYQWKEVKTEAQAYQVAFEFAERLLEFLETNITDFPEFENSTNYTVYKTSLIKTVDEFSDYININNSRLLFKRLQKPIALFQQKSLKALLGVSLAQEILTQLVDDSLTNANKLLLPYLKEYLAYSVFADNVLLLPIAFDNNGMYHTAPKNQQINSNDKTIPDNHLTFLKKNYETKAAATQKELIDLLNKFATNYPSFVAESNFYRKIGTSNSINSAESKSFFF
jgi:hypothetical protein